MAVGDLFIVAINWSGQVLWPIADKAAWNGRPMIGGFAGPLVSGWAQTAPTPRLRLLSRRLPSSTAEPEHQLGYFFSC